jgi:hypothetical protein
MQRAASFRETGGAATNSAAVSLPACSTSADAGHLFAGTSNELERFQRRQS